MQKNYTWRLNLLTNIKSNLQTVRNEINQAIKRRRDTINDSEVTLVAVTKNHDVTMIHEAIDNGVTEIGENRIQEASDKFNTLDRQVKWHLIGHLQTNKAKAAVKIFDLIHSIDSEHLATAVNNAAQSIDKVQDILIQVNLAKEDTKSGVYLEDLDSLTKTVDNLTNLRLCGLMMIAPNYEDIEQCRPLFSKMYGLFKQLQNCKGENIKYLSMGMTHDYKIAIEEGANIVRVGTAIFGARNYNVN